MRCGAGKQPLTLAGQAEQASVAAAAPRSGHSKAEGAAGVVADQRLAHAHHHLPVQLAPLA